jgi:hypothetical protein
VAAGFFRRAGRLGRFYHGAWTSFSQQHKNHRLHPRTLFLIATITHSDLRRANISLLNNNSEPSSRTTAQKNISLRAASTTASFHHNSHYSRYRPPRYHHHKNRSHPKSICIRARFTIFESTLHPSCTRFAYCEDLPANTTPVTARQSVVFNHRTKYNQ